MASYSDNFDRANGEIGANWVEDAGDIDIVSNVAESQTQGQSNRARYASALDSSNHFVQATCGGKGDSNHGSVTARSASSTETHYDASYVEDWAANGYRLFKRVSGSETELDSAASSSGAKVIKLTVDGATQSMEVGGVEVNSAADSAVSTGTYAGIWCYSNNGSRWNDWSAADLAAGGGSIPGNPFRKPFVRPFGGVL